MWADLLVAERSSRRSEERRVGKECRSLCDWSSDVCSSDLHRRLRRRAPAGAALPAAGSARLRLPRLLILPVSTSHSGPAPGGATRLLGAARGMIKCGQTCL